MITPGTTPGTTPLVTSPPAHDALAAADAQARARALDPRGSWLVQAPAGSGKTELLVQRILALLAIVDEPERIVATTFTVKAANEMRSRVMRALDDVRSGTAARSPHHAQTLALAAAALARDSERGWQLLAFPGRLDLGTLDALAARIAQQAPVASALGRLPPRDSEPQRLYIAAARTALQDAPATDVAWRAVLAHFDNDAGRIVNLLASLLARRDQWLPTIAHLRADAGRALLEAALASEVAEVLAQVRATIMAADDPDAATGGAPPLVEELHALMRYAADQRTDDAPFAALAAHAGLPAAHADALVHWRTLGDFLLTADDHGALRLVVNQRQGFPRIGKGAGSQDRRDAKERMERWLKRAAALGGLAPMVQRARSLPDPRYSEAARALIDALLEVLPRVVAQLTVVFAAEGACDFTEVTLRAIAALGHADVPSDVLLAHDLRIEHLLVDEFQDTSLGQMQFLARLTSGWNAGDGRTLFAVGDPMQSIYRFREADVRIFLNAVAQRRVGCVPVEALRLARNFRSQARLVDEVNALFPRIVAAQSPLQRAEVAFAAASAAVAATNDAMTFELARSVMDEAALVVRHVRAALDDGLHDVAILVRARNHLGAIHQALRQAGIAYQAVRLESLAERPVTLDLLWLVRALTQAADRHAWLAVLRAPWCGLALPDLLHVAEAAAGAGAPAIGAVVADAAIDAQLTPDGAARMVRLRAALRDALARRDLPLALRTRAAWFALAAPACYGGGAGGEVDLDAADAFFAMVARHERGGDLPDWDRFADAIARLNAEAPPDAMVRVKLMTLHAAKGLEFDAVILPGLARPSGKGDTPLLRWRARGERLLVASPRATADAEHDPIERYLRDVDHDDAQAELARLLYVGFTRARHRLHLVAHARSRYDDKTGKWQWKAPGKGTALATLWPALVERAPQPWEDEPGGADDGVDAYQDMPPLPLARLPLDFTLASAELQASVLALDAAAPAHRDDEAAPALAIALHADPVEPVYDWANATAAMIGTQVHAWLAQIAADGVAGWPPARVDALGTRVDVGLLTAGVPREALREARERVLLALRNTLADERGRWLLDHLHAHAAIEWALTAAAAQGVAHVVLDRSFIADGVRWIIDYKTSRHEGGGREAFLARERERHAPQLARYAHAVAQLDATPIRLALYYPLLGAFVPVDLP